MTIEPNTLKLIKSMKKDFVVVNKNYIAGTDINRQTLSLIYTDNSETFVGAIAELNGKKLPDYYVSPDRIYVDVMGLMERTFQYTTQDKLLYHIDNIKTDEKFNEIIAKKMVDGASIYYLDNKYPMYIFSSLHPINKSDVVSCDIYYCDSASYIAHFSINKPSHQIHEYIRYLYL